MTAVLERYCCSPIEPRSSFTASSYFDYSIIGVRDYFEFEIELMGAEALSQCRSACLVNHCISRYSVRVRPEPRLTFDGARAIGAWSLDALDLQV